MPRKPKDKDAANVWQEPSMKILDDFTKKILKVPKVELDKKLAQERKGKHPNT